MLLLDCFSTAFLFQRFPSLSLHFQFFFEADLDEEVKTGDKTLDEILPPSDIDHSHSFFPSFSFGSFSSSVVVHDSNGVGGV